MTRFAREFIIGFGFLTGFWIYVGVDPEAMVANAILQAMAEFMGKAVDVLGFVYMLIGIGSTVLSIWATYKAGGGLGIIATAIAFIAGLLIGTTFGISLLLFALCLGPFLPVTKEDEYSSW